MNIEKISELIEMISRLKPLYPTKHLIANDKMLVAIDKLEEMLIAEIAK